MKLASCVFWGDFFVFVDGGMDWKEKWGRCYQAFVVVKLASCVFLGDFFVFCGWKNGLKREVRTMLLSLRCSEIDFLCILG